MTRSRDIADQQDNLGGAVAPFVAGKNAVINGGFDFFQRGSLSTTGDAYGLDRWFKTSSGSGSNVSVTQQTTGVPAGSRFCMRVTMTGANGYGNQYQIIETLNVVPLQGKTVAISVKVRRNAAYAGNLTVSLEKSATVDAGMGGTYSTIASQGVLNASIPTGTTSADWYTIQLTTTIPNDGTANTLRLGVTQSQTESNCYWEMAQVQLEAGSQATPFSRAGGSIGGELALCQRYYVRYLVQDGYAPINSYGVGFSSTGVQAVMSVPVTMRTNIASVDASGVIFQDVASGSNFGYTSLSLNRASDKSAQLLFTGMSGITNYRQYTIYGNGNSAAYLGFSAEL